MIWPWLYETFPGERVSISDTIIFNFFLKEKYLYKKVFFYSTCGQTIDFHCATFSVDGFSKSSIIY